MLSGSTPVLISRPELDSLLQELKVNTTKKEFGKIKETLNSAPYRIKGDLFEEYLKFLYEKNGWIVTLTKKSHDYGVDLLLYHPSEPQRVDRIIQAKNHSRPIGYKELNHEVSMFDKYSRDEHSCSNFSIVTVNGAAKVDEIERFKEVCDIEDFNYIEKLIVGEKVGSKRREFNLFYHNEKAYEKVIRLWKKNNYACVVQATGTGKSYITAKILMDFNGGRKLFVAPSNMIINQLKNIVLNYVDESNVDYMTYQKLTLEKNLEKKSYDLIVFDEFHRSGAVKWGAKVKELVALNKNAKIFGTTATPVRHLDGFRNMADEIFDGNVASELSLEKAMLRNIIPTPRYVTALYTMEDEFESLRRKVPKLFSSYDEQKEAFNKLARISYDWEKSSGVDVVLKKYLSGCSRCKFVVFCESYDHLKSMRHDVCKWFDKTGLFDSVKPYTIISKNGEKKNSASLKRFSSKQSISSASLLFVVDMFNEGLHVSGVNGVVFLRKTASPTIYYQQLGRCLNVGGRQPIVFDFVNNVKNVDFNDLKNNYDDFLNEENIRRGALGLCDIKPNFSILDECKDARRILRSDPLEKISFEVMYDRICDHYLVDKVLPLFKGNVRIKSAANVVYSYIIKNKVSKEVFDNLIKMGFPVTKSEMEWYRRFAYIIYRYPPVERSGGMSMIARYNSGKWSSSEITRLKVWVAEQMLSISRCLLNKSQADLLKINGCIELFRRLFDIEFLSAHEIQVMFFNAKNNRPKYDPDMWNLIVAVLNEVSRSEFDVYRHEKRVHNSVESRRKKTLSYINQEMLSMKNASFALSLFPI